VDDLEIDAGRSSLSGRSGEAEVGRRCEAEVTPIVEAKGGSAASRHEAGSLSEMSPGRVADNQDCGRISPRAPKCAALEAPRQAPRPIAAVAGAAVPAWTDHHLPALAETVGAVMTLGSSRERDVNDAALRGRHRLERHRPPRLTDASAMAREPRRVSFAPAVVSLNIDSDEDALRACV